MISYTAKQVANRVTIFRCVNRSTLSETKKKGLRTASMGDDKPKLLATNLHI